jgi:hypothetical protein
MHRQDVMGFCPGSHFDGSKRFDLRLTLAVHSENVRVHRPGFCQACSVCHTVTTQRDGRGRETAPFRPKAVFCDGQPEIRLMRGYCEGVLTWDRYVWQQFHSHVQKFYDTGAPPCH